jgi:hypothetical protein
VSRRFELAGEFVWYRAALVSTPRGTKIQTLEDIGFLVSGFVDLDPDRFRNFLADTDTDSEELYRIRSGSELFDKKICLILQIFSMVLYVFDYVHGRKSLNA